MVHYSPESWSSHNFYSGTKPLSWFWRTEDVGEARFSSGWRSSAARERWWSKDRPVHTRWWSRLAPQWPKETWSPEERHRRHRAWRRAVDTTRLGLAWQKQRADHDHGMKAMLEQKTGKRGVLRRGLATASGPRRPRWTAAVGKGCVGDSDGESYYNKARTTCKKIARLWVRGIGRRWKGDNEFRWWNEDNRWWAEKGKRWAAAGVGVFKWAWRCFWTSPAAARVGHVGSHVSRHEKRRDGGQTAQGSDETDELLPVLL
jgi:hypothetical protein